MARERLGVEETVGQLAEAQPAVGRRRAIRNEQIVQQHDGDGDMRGFALGRRRRAIGVRHPMRPAEVGDDDACRRHVAPGQRGAARWLGRGPPGAGAIERELEAAIGVKLGHRLRDRGTLGSLTSNCIRQHHVDELIQAHAFGLSVFRQLPV